MAQVFSTVISINPEDKTVRFLSAVGQDKTSLQTDVKTFKARPFSEEFYGEFTKFLRDYSAAKPSYAGKAAKVTLVLPDHLVLCDSINIPGINRKSTENLTTVAIEAKYCNLRELKYNKFVSASNKQYSTINLVVIRQKLLQELYTCCAGSNMFASTVTYAANATVNAAMTLTGKLRNGTYVLVDIKETFTRMAFVVKGITLGAYDLPFGYAVLSQTKLLAENMLWEHSVAELAVLNAKEKAKAKQLTMMGGDVAAQQGEAQVQEQMGETEGDDTISFATGNEVQRNIAIKTLPKKTPRVLPKFMQRPVPETPEGYECENFRVFVKWALEFVAGNPRLTAIGSVDIIYVNMPQQYDHIFDVVNQEKEENGVEFVSLNLAKEREVVAQNLELYGGLFVSQFNSQNNF